MKNVLSALAFIAALTAPAVASTIDATLIPDGTYVVKVAQVQDASHVRVVMQNGVETTLTARSTINFLNVKPNQTLKVSVIKGQVPVFLIQ